MRGSCSSRPLLQRFECCINGAFDDASHKTIACLSSLVKILQIEYVLLKHHNHIMKFFIAEMADTTQLGWLNSAGATPSVKLPYSTSTTLDIIEYFGTVCHHE